MLIDEAMQRKHWPDEDPLGKYVRFGGPNEVPFTIVGVVREVRKDGLDLDALPIMYLSAYQARPQPATSFVIRTQGDPQAQASIIRSEIWRLDSQQAIANINTLDNIIARSLSGRRFSMTIFSVFALIAVILASVGIYSVISYSVTQRVHEFGIRLALGAQRKNVLSMVVRQGMILALSGVAIGLIASFLLTRVISKMLYGVSPIDIATFLLASALSLTLAPLACLIPARRATRVNPLIALREE
jgi:putative ABC transport system permease protein